MAPSSPPLCARCAVALFAVFVAACRNQSATPEAACSPDAGTALYARKIEPILHDDHPVTCNQCHLSGIDLSLFVRETPCQTMACLLQLDLVDFTHPERSKVLTWIKRAHPDSKLITADVIEQEYEGFLEWIQFSARCGAQVCETYTDACGDDQPDASIKCELSTATSAGFVDRGDCSELTLEQLFSSDVYEWRERCFPCHFTSDTLVAAPKWITDVDRAGTPSAIACSTASLETMRTVLGDGLVDLAHPTRSLLLRKPLSVEGGGVMHGGGAKFDGQTDPSYESFLAWITRYAGCIAQNPGLERAGAPPPAVMGDGGMSSSVYDYCNCILRNCHAEAHAKWGASDEQVIAECRSEGVALPTKGEPTGSGNYFECRAMYCAQAATMPEACSAALGDSICL